MTHPHDCESRRRAFTLIELLVVISIIAMLIAVLLPALQSARGQARIIQCLANERQLQLVCQSYVDANRDYYPPLYAVAPDGGTYGWMVIIAPYLNPSLSFNGSGNTSLSNGDYKVTRCPAYQGTGGGPTTYAVNGCDRWTFKYGWGVCTRRYGKILKPSRTFLYADYMPHWAGCYAYGYGDAKVDIVNAAAWHNGRINFVHCDGHAVTMRLEDVPWFQAWDNHPIDGTFWAFGY
ncbi:MAG: prepilin-type N-terminal cleavage/methylation domain-containing protein [Phycisphaeraceae bacterium]|nr:prepilin-type N-terminal cleavage/methylation domain-containing protein [Phycisphaeraceae bacterium]